MMCFRDMTFCTYFQDCKNAGDCPRPLTDDVREAAQKWAYTIGAEIVPIATWTEKPDCHEKVEIAK